MTIAVAFNKPSKPAETKKPVIDFETVLLSEDDIPAFLDLQQKVLDYLPEGQKHFLKKRTPEDLKAHWEARMPIIGIREKNSGALVAQALLAYPFDDSAVKNLDGYPLGGMTATTAIVQSLATDPSYNGYGLAQKILDVAKDVAVMSGHARVLAKVAQANVASGKSFLRNGFDVASAGDDPKLGYAVNFYRYDLYKAAAAPESVARSLKVA